MEKTYECSNPRCGYLIESVVKPERCPMCGHGSWKDIHDDVDDKGWSEDGTENEF